jgi:hypothetical protein
MSNLTIKVSRCLNCAFKCPRQIDEFNWEYGCSIGYLPSIGGHYEVSNWWRPLPSDNGTQDRTKRLFPDWCPLYNSLIITELVVNQNLGLPEKPHTVWDHLMEKVK